MRSPKGTLISLFSLLSLSSSKLTRPYMSFSSSSSSSSSSASTSASFPQLMSARDYAKTLWATRDGLYATDVHALVKCRCEEDLEFQVEPLFRFAYMPMRNRGELIRLLLEESQVPYELEAIGFKNWEGDGVVGVKHTAPHGKCPILRNYDGNGNDLCQEGAITRYLAERLGLCGATLDEKAYLDSLYTLWFSTMRNNGLSHDGEHYSVASLKLAKVNEEIEKSYLSERKNRPSYQSVFRLNNLSKAERSLLILDHFEDLLEKSSTGYLAPMSSSPSYVDFALFYILFELAEDDNLPHFDQDFGLPNLRSFLQRIEDRPQIKEYLQSPRRMPRYARKEDGTSLYTYIEGKYSPRVE